MPVSCSPPGGKLHKNNDPLSPSEEGRCCTNQGLVLLVAPSGGVLIQVSELSSTERRS